MSENKEESKEESKEETTSQYSAVEFIALVNRIAGYTKDFIKESVENKEDAKIDESEEKDERVRELISSAVRNHSKGEKYVNTYTAHALSKHSEDDLWTMIRRAVSQGFTGFEWIQCDTSMSQPIISKWCTSMVENQGLTNVAQIYFNEGNRRYGVTLCSEILKKYNLVNSQGTCFVLNFELRDHFGF